MWSVFIKRFEELHEIAAQHYLRKEKEEFHVLLRKILLLQENILQKMAKSKRFKKKNTSIKTVTRANIAILKTFTDRGISKAPLTVIQNIYLFLICLTKKIITKELDFKV